MPLQLVFFPQAQRALTCGADGSLAQGEPLRKRVEIEELMGRQVAVIGSRD